MAGFKCPYCGAGEMVLECSPDHVSHIGGVPVTVPDAQVSKCTSCGRTTVSAKELKRWRRIQQAQLQTAGHVPSPEEVRRIRESFGLSVSEFACLLAVTRQTVHAWERRGAEGMQLGPAAILLRLLAKEVAGKATDVYAHLLSEAAERGQAAEAAGERTRAGDFLTAQAQKLEHARTLRARPGGCPAFLQRTKEAA